MSEQGAIARGSLPGMRELIESMTQPNEQLIETITKALDQCRDAVTAVEQDKRIFSIEYHSREWLRALLEENKRLNGLMETAKEAISAVVTESSKDKSDTDKWIESVTSEARGYLVQLQQTREELEQIKEVHGHVEMDLGSAISERNDLQTELEQVKAERDAWHKQADKLFGDVVDREGELSAKGKVLEWYGDTENYIPFAYEPHFKQKPVVMDQGDKAQSILSQYKGEPNETS